MPPLPPRHLLPPCHALSLCPSLSLWLLSPQVTPCRPQGLMLAGACTQSPTAAVLHIFMVWKGPWVLVLCRPASHTVALGRLQHVGGLLSPRI
ncbi:unnamed protein product [Gulo gulo]|uniref:Uncharacterized protein n=1 Tax=Gulo gulo TaxID=48420 RepID=A0A9X9LJA1_GULGU|nr:unnamed protein product [Gulo gulo]